jgi:Fe-coproporphyrin III synthase
MIGISKLYCDNIEPSDILRYKKSEKNIPSHLLQYSNTAKPVVVWNITKKCNLKCLHCYSRSDEKKFFNELSLTECKNVINDLADFGVPVILFSGGEPLARKNILDLIKYTTASGIRAVLSTNGTLITNEIAYNLKNAGITYVGISIDGLKSTHDFFRNQNGAFEQAIRGIKICQQYGIKVGLRFTITKKNMNEITEIFNFIVENNIPRICFYHLVCTGRGNDLIDDTLTLQETRDITDLIINLTKKIYDNGFKKEVLTVDNHADGVYLYLKMLKENKDKAEKIYALLKMNSGNNSGDRIGCINWDGTVFPDQFLRDCSFGNVKDSSFSQIWTDITNPIINKFKNKKKFVKGRCAKCKYLNICGGNLRARAKALTGDLWSEDPGCYLTDQEIGILKN